MDTIHISDLNYADAANLFDTFLICRNKNGYVITEKQILSSLTKFFISAKELQDFYLQLSTIQNEIETAINNVNDRDTIDSQINTNNGLFLKNDANYKRSLLLTRENLKSVLDTFINNLDLSTAMEEFKLECNSTIGKIYAETINAIATSRHAASNRAGQADIAGEISQIELTVEQPEP